MSDGRRGATHDKFISSFVQIVERQRAVELNQEETTFKGTTYWADKYFVAGIESFPCTAEQKTRMKKVFDRFDELARLNKRAFANDGLKKKAVIAPIEFIAIAYLIDQYGHRDNSEIESAIRTMRRNVREEHQDNVRRKQVVWDTIFASVRESLGPRGTKRPSSDEYERQADPRERKASNDFRAWLLAK